MSQICYHPGEFGYAKRDCDSRTYPCVIVRNEQGCYILRALEMYWRQNINTRPPIVYSNDKE